jgi:hypothetical protein
MDATQARILIGGINLDSETKTQFTPDVLYPVSFFFGFKMKRENKKSFHFFLQQ